MYRFSPSGQTYNEDTIPSHLRRYADNNNPFNRITSIVRQVEYNVGPHTDFYYKRGTTAPSVPSLASFDYPDTAVADIMDNNGWSATIPSGTGTLYHTRITWSVSDSVSAASASPVQSDDIQYSTDGGNTFSNTPPSDYDDVDAIQTHVAGYGWVQFSTRETVRNPFVIGGNALQGGGLPQYIDLTAGGTNFSYLTDNYRIGLRLGQTHSWGNSVLHQEGLTEYPTTFLRLITPAEYEAATIINGFIGGKTYLLSQDLRSGAVQFGVASESGHIDTFNNANQQALHMMFMTAPVTTVQTANSATQNGIYLVSTAGISVGDTLFVEQEQMTVTSVSSAHNTFGLWVGLTRGVNGTTAAAHGAGVTARALVNRTALRQLVVTRRTGSVQGWTELRLYRLRVPGAE